MGKWVEKNIFTRVKLENYFDGCMSTFRDKLHNNMTMLSLSEIQLIFNVEEEVTQHSLL